MVKHAFWWYFMLFWDKFQIIASVLVIWNISPAGTRVAPSESRSTHQLLLTFGSDRLLLITSSQPCIWILKHGCSIYSLCRISLMDACPHPIASIWNNTHTLMLLLLLLMLIWIFGCQVLPTSDADLVQVQWHWQWRWCLFDEFSPHKCWVLVLVLIMRIFS